LALNFIAMYFGQILRRSTKE